MAFYLVCNASATEEQKRTANTALKQANVDYFEMNVRGASAVLSEIDKEHLRKLQRKSYERRDSIREKRLEYYTRPGVIERRREYNRNPENRQKKKDAAKRKNELLRSIRESQPELYAKFVLAQNVKETSTAQQGVTQ